jgi:chemotaxis signal transduction protein
LLVVAEGMRLGFPLAAVEQVLDLGAAYPAPGVVPAVRGVTEVGGHLVPLVHLAALLGGAPPPPDRRATGVAARCGGRVVVFEVDDVETVILDEPLPVPEGWRVPWARGVAKGEQLIPILDVDALAERLAPERVG